MIQTEEYLNCFACGQNNPRGLKLSFNHDEGEKLTTCLITLPSDLEGWPGIIHGGIVTTILDECAYYAIMHSGSQWDNGFTTNINLNFEHPTPANQPLLAKAWVDGQKRRLLYCQTELLRQADMKLLASARITYFMMPKRADA